MKVLVRSGALLAVASGVRLLAGGAEATQGPASPSVLDSLLLASVEASEVEERRRRPLAPGERVDPNTADTVELARLPGIGPALARRIVQERASGGAFVGLDDLQRVRGIGTKSLDRLGPVVRLEPQVRGPPARAGARVVNGPAAGSALTVPTSAGSPAANRSRVSIDLDRATAEELVALPGIGPVLAARIVENRKRFGPFRSVAALERVRGIGPARIAAIEAALRPSRPP